MFNPYDNHQAASDARAEVEQENRLNAQAVSRTELGPVDFGVSDDELEALSIEQRNAVLDEITEAFEERARQMGDVL